MLFLLFFGYPALALEPKEQYSEMSFNERVLIQSNLKQLGYYEQELDGIWGANTESAIRSFMIECCSTVLTTQSQWSSALAQVLYLEVGAEEGSAGRNEEVVGNDGSAEELPAWVPNWLRVRPLDETATVADWVNATEALQLASAGTYQLSTISDSQLRFSISSGFLLRRAQKVKECLNQIIQVGVSTGQLRAHDLMYPRLANSCVVASAFPD